MTKEEYTKITLAKINEAKDRYQKIALQNAPPIKEEDPRSVAESIVNQQLERAYSQGAIVIYRETPVVHHLFCFYNQRKPRMKVHDQDQLVKLLIEEALDPRVIEEEKLRVERHKVRVTKLKEHEDDQKRAKEIVDRISAFEKKPSGDVVVKLNENKKPVGIHKQINEFNKKIMEDAQWGESIFMKDNKAEKEQGATPQSYAAKKKDKNPLNQLFSARDPRDRNPLARGNQSVNSSIGNSRPSTSHTRKQVQSPNASLLHKKLLEAKEIEGRISSGTKRDNFQSMLKITDPSAHRAPIMPSNLNMLSQRASTSSKAFRTQPNSRKNSAIDLPKIDSINEKHG